MAWSTPKTWAVGDILTASDMNTYVRDNTNFLNTPPSCRAYNNADISIATSASTVLTFNSERWDNDTIHSTVTNTGRLTCRTAGLYHIHGNIAWQSSTDSVASSTDSETELRAMNIRLDGTTTIAAISQPPVVSGTLETRMSINTIYSLAVDNYLELLVTQNSGAALNIVYNTQFSPEFGMTYLGKAS